MPSIISIATLDLPYKLHQSELKGFARNLFAESFPDIDRLVKSFDNTNIETRNMCVPIDFFKEDRTFREKNKLYVESALKYSVEAVEKCLANAGMEKNEVTDIIFISTTGLSTPSIDALIINEMKLGENVKRTPVWGLGCAGGVSGLAKADTIVRADKDAVVLLVAVELCSLTFIRNDLSKSNFIATSLFSDGVGACIIADESKSKDAGFKVNVLDSGSKLYYDALDVMGWDFVDEGFKVIFSRDIPTIVKDNVKEDILTFLEKSGTGLKDIKNFVIHPGGIKVINAYLEALDINKEDMKNTTEVMRDYGNMSSVTVIYVLERFLNNGFREGKGLMMSLGPGFSSEMVLLDMKRG